MRIFFCCLSLGLNLLDAESGKLQGQITPLLEPEEWSVKDTHSETKMCCPRDKSLNHQKHYLFLDYREVQNSLCISTNMKTTLLSHIVSC